MKKQKIVSTNDQPLDYDQSFETSNRWNERISELQDPKMLITCNNCNN